MTKKERNKLLDKINEYDNIAINIMDLEKMLTILENYNIDIKYSDTASLEFKAIFGAYENDLKNEVKEFLIKRIKILLSKSEKELSELKLEE